MAKANEIARLSWNDLDACGERTEQGTGRVAMSSASARAAYWDMEPPWRSKIESVVHGDPHPGNIRMTADRVALIDWDESHVDAPTSTWCCHTTPPV